MKFEHRAIIQNLSSKANWQHLKDHFGSCKDIVYVTAHKIPRTGTIQFKSRDSLAKAIRKYDRSKLFGRSINMVAENLLTGTNVTNIISSVNKSDKLRNKTCSRDDRSSGTTNNKRVSFEGKTNFTLDGMMWRTNKPKHRIAAPSLKSVNGKNERAKRTMNLKKKTRDKNVAFEGEIVNLSDGECAKNDNPTVEDQSVSMDAENHEINASQSKAGMDCTADNHNFSKNNQRTDIHLGSNDAAATIAQNAVTALQEEIEILDEMNSGKAAPKTENSPLLITNNGITIYDSRFAATDKNQGQKSNYHKNQNENVSTVPKQGESLFASGIGNVVLPTLNVSSKEKTPESSNLSAERGLINHRDGSGTPLHNDNENVKSSKEKEASLNIMSSKQMPGNKLDFTAQTRQFQIDDLENRSPTNVSSNSNDLNAEELDDDIEESDHISLPSSYHKTTTTRVLITDDDDEIIGYTSSISSETIVGKDN